MLFGQIHTSRLAMIWIATNEPKCSVVYLWELFDVFHKNQNTCPENDDMQHVIIVWTECSTQYILLVIEVG